MRAHTIESSLSIASLFEFQCWLSDVGNHRCYYFTKKKDFEEALQKNFRTKIVK